jgi:polyhydroxybutyrate depolymerase
MRAPASHAATAPLLVLLHGYGSDHANVATHLGIAPLADSHGFYVALPDGTPDRDGARFWNASDACCDFDNLAVDDVAYLDAILDDALARYPIDPARIYVAGFSNGGFMAHRYACDRASRVTAVVSFAGEPTLGRAAWRVTRRPRECPSASAPAATPQRCISDVLSRTV